MPYLVAVVLTIKHYNTLTLNLLLTTLLLVLSSWSMAIPDYIFIVDKTPTKKTGQENWKAFESVLDVKYKDISWDKVIIGEGGNTKTRILIPQ